MSCKSFILNFLASLSLVLAYSCQEQITPPEEQKPDTDEPEVPEVVVDPQADSVTNALFKQIKAMQAVLSDTPITVSSYEEKPGGKFAFNLSNGSSFDVYLGDEDLVKVMSYVDEADMRCWMYADAQGNVSSLKDQSGKAVPVDNSLSVEVEEGNVSLLVGEETILTSATTEDVVQAFSLVLHSDNAGAAYAASFIFADEKKVVIPVSSYEKEIYFTEVDGEDRLETYFVGYGQTETLSLVIPEGVEFEFEVPEGWTAVEDEDATEGCLVKITAPSNTEENDNIPSIKVLFEDTVLFTELPLFCDPFKEVFASAVKAVILPAGGVGKFAYGLSSKADYNEDDVIEKAAELLDSETEQTGAGVSEGEVVVALNELYGDELTAGQEYILWAAIGETAISYEFIAFNIETELGESTILDTPLSMTISGASAIYGGVEEKSDGWVQEILDRINTDRMDSLDVTQQPYEFEGNASEFPTKTGLSLQPSKTYVVWVVSDVNGTYEYSEDDLFYYEFTTKSIVPGGDLIVEMGEAKSSLTSISSEVSCDGAAMICYSILNDTNGKRYSAEDNPEITDEVKYDAMQNKCIASYSINGTSGTAIGEGLDPNTAYWIYAVAVDEDGKYGKVKCVSSKTSVVTYDEGIKLNAETLTTTSKSTTIKVTSTGGDLSEYIYWFGSVQDSEWLKMGATRNSAQKYMVCYPDEDFIKRVMNKYGSLSSDGTINFTNLRMETNYVFIILEKGENGYSKAATTFPVTLAADLGDIVRTGTDTWNNAKSQIVLDWKPESFNQAASAGLLSGYGFDFSCPKNLTAYIMCASEHYFEGAGLNKVEHQIIDIENYCSRTYDSSYTPYVDGEYLTEPDYYKNGELHKGQLMNVYNYYVHGVPSLGSVTYFAEGSHGEGNCIHWENGKCTGWENALVKRARHHTMVPSEQKAAAFGLEGQEAIDWAKALYNAYLPFYQDEPVILENDGSSLAVYNPYATGVNEDGVVPDRVIVVLKDLAGNYYEPMMFEVPNYFK